MKPPKIDARVPVLEIPPFVPGGTVLRVVMRMGGVLDRIPSSEARVSPRQQEKCLKDVRFRASVIERKSQ